MTRPASRLRPPEGLWDRIRAEPDRAPEHIALAAAEQLAPSAARWAAENAGQPGVAAGRRAVKRHVRLSRAEGAAAGLAGGWGIVPDLVAVAWLQSRMVFHVAASFGFDPYHPMRPAELLVLQQVYETANEARSALDGVGRHIAIQYASSRAKGRENLARSLMKLVGERTAKRMAAKLIPGVASPIMAVQNANATAVLGERAMRFYGGE